MCLFQERRVNFAPLLRLFFNIFEFSEIFLYTLDESAFSAYNRYTIKHNILYEKHNPY